MSKAEERGKIYALHKASEKLNDYYGSAMLSVVQFDGYDIKNAYIEGCHQAEKDLELTWEDVKMLQNISSTVYAEVAQGSVDYYQIYPTEQSFLEEVLKRFKERKQQ